MELQGLALNYYETGCKRCGKCCSPGFSFKDRFVRLKGLSCIYLGDDNLCTVYQDRKRIVGCFSPWEMPLEWMPEDCFFGGKMKEISGTDLEEFLSCPPPEFIAVISTGFFKRR